MKHRSLPAYIFRFLIVLVCLTGWFSSAHAQIDTKRALELIQQNGGQIPLELRNQIPTDILNQLPSLQSGSQAPLLTPSEARVGQQPNTSPQVTPQEQSSDSDSNNGDEQDAKEEEADPEDEDDKQKIQSQVQIAPGRQVFGHEIFRQESVDFQRGTSLIPPSDYIVGPNDQFVVTIWGSSELTTSLPVQSDGSIFYNSVGKIYVAGLTYKKTVELITKRFRSIVSPFSTIEVMMGQNRRSINVNIIGEVGTPGTYELAATTTAFNALFEAGGITNLGSVRNIYIKRGNKTEDQIDLYDYLIRGDTRSVYLQEDDFIFVPAQRTVVEIEGNVKRPMAYELKEGEGLKDLIEFAGGLTYDARKSTVQVIRTQNDQQSVVNLSLDSILSANTSIPLNNGDVVLIKSINIGLSNIAQITGPVIYPDVYEIEAGERVSDLIKKAGGLGADAYLKRAYLLRFTNPDLELEYVGFNLGAAYLWNSMPSAQRDSTIEAMYKAGDITSDSLSLADILALEDSVLSVFADPPLQFFDNIIIFSEQDFRDTRYILVEGEVRKPGLYILRPGMNLRDLLFLAGGLKRDADRENIVLTTLTTAEDLAAKRTLAYKQQQLQEQLKLEETAVETGAGQEGDTDSPLDILEESTDPKSRLTQRISVKENWQDDFTLDTVKLSGFDNVKVYSKYDFIFFQYIEVEGAVQKPGTYQLTRNMSLKDILYQAGG
ncbi:MAG: SLBB domain-containing protein, partial [Bacteroidota bacterium]